MSDTKTYRGRSLEELLPKIRAELGPDALVLKRREGLAGGVGGFFQHPYVEVEARAPVRDPEVEVRSDRATAEGLASPAMQSDAALAGGHRPVLLCSARVRRHLRRLVEQRLPQLAVCSYNEVVPGVGVETSGVLTLGAPMPATDPLLAGVGA